ncbi:MAG: helix-turn-helix transcriptional regulator [Kiritimatiellae bacterium]|nr:helix-turn-helix transcriptional regulator [Kiritimatiellia bacterium]
MKTIHDRRYTRLITELRQIRRRSGLTQAQVAQKMGWAKSTLSKIETRERRLDLLETYDLCGLYGIRLTDLERLLRGKREC